MDQYLFWPYRGGSLSELTGARPQEGALPPPEPDEILARVEAVSICSSDLKIIRLGTDHPLFSSGSGPRDTVLGHEVCLRVAAVGASQSDRFCPGQRLALQPAMRVAGVRRIIGMDLPGGFAQMLRLGPEALRDYVFEAPEDLPAASVAMLEPYGCVERAYRPNARTALSPEGRTLIVLGAGAETYGTADPPPWADLSILALGGTHLPGFLEGGRYRSVMPEALGTESFDDIIALGEIGADMLARLPASLTEGGMLLQARQSRAAPVPVDPVRVHYDALSFTGTTERDFMQALSADRQRFDVKPGGIALIHGAGGAMGRIHVHRLLQLENGPRRVIATSRKGRRLDALKCDFTPLADRLGRELEVIESEALESVIAASTPDGIDDAVVVAPDVGAVGQAAAALAPDGLLSIFAGFPYGQSVDFDLSGVATDGKRLTGSTGCSVEDMRDVLVRARSGELDLTANIKAIAGLERLPEALEAVSDGRVAGKVVVYPQRPALPFCPLENGWIGAEEAELIGPAD